MKIIKFIRSSADTDAFSGIIKRVKIQVEGWIGGGGTVYRDKIIGIERVKGGLKMEGGGHWSVL